MIGAGVAALLGLLPVLVAGAEGARPVAAGGIGAGVGALGALLILGRRLGVLGSLLIGLGSLSGPFLVAVAAGWIVADPGHLFAGLLIGIAGSTVLYLGGWRHEQPD